MALLLCLGEKDHSNLPAWKVNILRKTTQWTCWAAAFLACIVSQKRVQVKADYSKYLGPDYKYTYDGASMHITNHQCQLDMLLVITLH